MKTNQIYSIRFVIKRGKTKNEKAPVVCRITINGKRGLTTFVRTQNLRQFVI